MKQSVSEGKKKSFLLQEEEEENVAEESNDDADVNTGADKVDDKNKDLVQ